MRVGTHRQPVTLSKVSTTAGDSDGILNPLTPAEWWVSLMPIGGSGDGRTLVSTVVMRFHPQVNLDTCVSFYDEVLLRDRQLFVRGVRNVDGRNVELECTCEEIEP